MAEKFRNISQRVFKARWELELTRKRNVSINFVSLSKAKEAFMKQKSRNSWFKLGDHNTTFFFFTSFKVVKCKEGQILYKVPNQ